MNSDMFGVRRTNLRRLVLDKHEGNRAAFSRAAAVHQNQVNLLLTDNDKHRRNLGESLARKMEVELGIPSGWFDECRKSSSGTTYVINCTSVPDSFQHIFRDDGIVRSMSVSDAMLARLSRGITAKENLRLWEVATHEMSPEICMCDHAIVDSGVKAIGTDGIYLVEQDGETFLRRVIKQLSGGWLIQSPNPAHESTKIDSLNDVTAVGKVAMVWKSEVL